MDEINKSKGMFYEWFGIELPDRVDVAGELDKREGWIGASDEEGNYYTLSHFKSDVNAISNRIGAYRQNELNSSTLATKCLNDEKLWDEYTSIGKDENGQQIGVYTDWLDDKLAYRKNNPEVDASLFFWGEVETLQSYEAYNWVQEWLSVYAIADEALPKLALIDERSLQIDSEWKDDDIAYSALSDTYKDRELADAHHEYYIDHPDYQKAALERTAIQAGVPDELVDDYVDYYFKDNRDWSANDKKRWWLEHQDFYNEVWIGVLENQPFDHNYLANVPTKDEDDLMAEYYAITKEAYGDDFEAYRLLFRWNHRDIDALLVKYHDMKPIDSFYEPPTAEEGGGYTAGGLQEFLFEGK